MNKSKITAKNCYPKVLKRVQKGEAIYQILSDLGIDRGQFYKNISDEQKTQLQMAKTNDKEYPAPKMIAIANAEMERVLLQDAEKYQREYKSHLEYILEQYAQGNVKIRVPNTQLWVDVNTDYKVNPPGNGSASVNH